MKARSLLSAACSALVAISVIAPMASAQDKVRLIGSGASFPFPIYAAWFKEFSKVSNGITVDYQSKGSGAGIQDLINKTVDFAASDSAMTDEQIAKVPQGVQLLPMTAGEIVLAYNLPGVKDLRLPRDVYVSMFLGKITKWNDPKIAAANPSAKLPDMPITIVRRADSSGTTFVFTNHLSAISPEWKQGPGAGNTVNWPQSDKIVASPKNDGVTATVKQTKGAIGYIEYSFAKLSKAEVALIENKAGKYVAPGGEGGIQALANAKLPADMRLWLTDPEGDKAYPIATYTWMMFYKKYDDPKKTAAIHKMIEYCLTEGQKMSDKMGYLPLPQNVVAEVRKATSNIN
ncbi:MAG: phosphate ABC transporter substrate-binding protein PstS [Burkholderiales bacterium]